ncbi:MAG: tetratricopeptide repeat protein, partial [Actinomycetia bacterium]|nr:tetratricopeptide repeat protein [Actinomycetes bacterium]
MVQIETLLRVALVLMLVLIVAFAGYFLLKFFQERNRPPRTYYEYQLAIWKNSLERYPKSPDVHTNLGYIYLKMGEDGKGVGYL